MTIFFKLFVWMLCWAGIKGAYYLSENKGTHYIDRPFLTSIYFLLASCFVLFFFREEFSVMRLPTMFSILTFLVFLGFIWSVYYLSPQIFSKDRLAANTLIFAKMDWKYAISKSFEILFQQSLIYVLLQILVQRALTDSTLYLIFSVTFGAVHLPLLKIKGKALGIYFTCFAFIAGLLFPYLILHFPQGYLYSYMLHWSFYIGSGIVYNVLKGKRINI